MSDSSRISPTAHYTGYVWSRNGLSHPELRTVEGRVLFETVRPWMLVAEALRGDTLEHYLLARHRSIDMLLEQAIDSGTVGQVVEVACGLSPRGWRFTQKYGERLHYVEADLPGMAERKRAALERMGSLSDRHQVVELDALLDEGPGSLTALAETLDPDQGLALITEGLIGYLDTESVEGVWARFARVLHRFPAGRYFSDLHLGDVQTPEIRAFRVVLGAFVRGAVHLHFASAAEGVVALKAAGFDDAAVTPASELAGTGSGKGARLVHILEASTVCST